MPRYELLQDLPGCKKGTIGTPYFNDCFKFGASRVIADNWCFCIREMDHHTDWFRILPDEPKVECWKWEGGATHVKTIDGKVVDAFGEPSDRSITLNWAMRHFSLSFGVDRARWASETPAEYDAAKQEAEAKRVEASKPKVERYADLMEASRSIKAETDDFRSKTVSDEDRISAAIQSDVCLVLAKIITEARKS